MVFQPFGYGYLPIYGECFFANYVNYERMLELCLLPVNYC